MMLQCWMLKRYPAQDIKLPRQDIYQIRQPKLISVRALSNTGIYSLAILFFLIVPNLCLRNDLFVFENISKKNDKNII